MTGLTVGGADAGNYALASDAAATTANIARRPVTGAVTAADKVYDGSRTAAILGRTLGGVLGSDAVGLTGGAALFDTSDAGSGKTVTATGLALGGAKAADYVLSNPSETARAAVTPRPVTGTVFADDKIYDGTADATLAGTSLAGVLPGDAVTLGGGAATFDRTGAGAATVTAFGLVLIGPRRRRLRTDQPHRNHPRNDRPPPRHGHGRRRRQGVRRRHRRHPRRRQAVRRPGGRRGRTDRRRRRLRFAGRRRRQDRDRRRPGALGAAGGIIPSPTPRKPRRPPSRRW